LCTPQVPSHLIPEEVLFSVSHCLHPCFYFLFHFHSPYPFSHSICMLCIHTFCPVISNILTTTADSR
jgi:hypothetical protein